jgi:TrmH family RNA methyltransferase
LITSPHNEQLKTIGKLRRRRWRDKLGLFAAEGEDLVDAAAQAGWQPRILLRAGEDVEPELLAAVSSLGSGSRVIGVYEQRWSEPGGQVMLYLHAVDDPGNVGTILRSAHALSDGPVLLGPGCADPFSPKAVRASMGSVFAQAVARAEVAATPSPRVALVAHGGEAPAGRAPATLCLGAEREGLPERVLAHCERRWTIPLREGGAESLNVAAAAAIALGRISSAA